ncbi:MAG: hypothetical protein KAR06_02405 [Deltaproteobacteria bacterium]|nr:hypothetical protein [Deltaproteobacteria bacterium]
MSRQGTGRKDPEAGEDKTPTSEAESKETATPEKTAAETVKPEEVAERGTSEDASPKVRAVKQKMFKIIIDEQDNSDMNRAVQCTDGQGKQFLIQRGKEVTVPEGVVNVLRESVYEVYQEVDGKDIKRSIPRYALRILEEL